MANPLSESIIRGDDAGEHVFKVGDLISIQGYDYVGEIEKVNADGADGTTTTYAINMKNDKPEHKPKIEASRLTAAPAGKKNGDRLVARPSEPSCLSGCLWGLCHICVINNGKLECCGCMGTGPICTCNCKCRCGAN